MMLSSILSILDRSKEFEAIVGNINQNIKEQYVSGLSGCAFSYFVSSLRHKLNRPFLIIMQNTEEAERVYQDLSSFFKDTFLFPALDTYSSSDLPSKRLVSERLMVLDKLVRGEPVIVITCIKTILYRLISKDLFRKSIIHLCLDQDIDRDGLISSLVHLGYEITEMVEEVGEGSARGGIVDIYSPSYSLPLRIELYGDKILSIRSFSPTTQRSISFMKDADILPANESVLSKSGDLKSSLIHYLPSNSVIIIDEKKALQKEAHMLKEEVAYQGILTFEQIMEQARDRQIIYTSLLDESKDGINFSVKPMERFSGRISGFTDRLKDLKDLGYQIVIAANYKGQGERIKELLEEYGVSSVLITTHNPQPTTHHSPLIFISNLSSGFDLPEIKMALITDKEIFGYPTYTRRRRFAFQGEPITSYLDLKTNDYVVHELHGIGVYLGINNIEVEGKKRDFITILYAEGDRLYVPIDQISLVQKYVGDKDHPPSIYRLGGTSWERTKSRVKKSIRTFARELLELYAIRLSRPGYAFSQDTAWQYEFEAGFTYEETEDQLKAVRDIKRDMEQKRPMDRLLCGDVGFGKTEVAIRASFKAVMDGKQVVVLCPTTILALQHFNTFKERLAPYPIKVEMLSRFQTRVEQKRIISELKRGLVDIVIGTHRLIQDDIDFHDLGLLIIDEEHRFGVAHKERLKRIRKLVDVLTLTATPIPRTLYLSLGGVRDMSTINTPPLGRLPIKTYISEFSEDLIREAVLKEMERSGQIYFVHNRIETIYKMYCRLREILPFAKITVAHGKMTSRELEEVMIDFLDKRYDILLSTSIIESGLDMPNVNTIIINDAHRFGLAELYQLRGRVGRGSRSAYAYLFYPNESVLSRDAKERLRTIKEFTDLGSGFKIAMRDLEIRGAGNLLGKEQSGNILQIGLPLYCKLLRQTVSELKGEHEEETLEPRIDVPYSAYIPDTYIPSSLQRFAIYKRMQAASQVSDVLEIKDELKDRYGKLPEVVENLLKIIELRVRAKHAGVLSIGTSDHKISIELKEDKDIVSKILHITSKFPSQLKVDPQKTNLLTLSCDNHSLLEEVLEELSFEWIR
ncbi:MAG: transcription-repair coupling factor [bacterium]|nr:transcription-repair coupling factor [bacterium]